MYYYLFIVFCINYASKYPPIHPAAMVVIIKILHDLLPYRVISYLVSNSFSAKRTAGQPPDDNEFAPTKTSIRGRVALHAAFGISN